MVSSHIRLQFLKHLEYDAIIVDGSKSYFTEVLLLIWIIANLNFCRERKELAVCFDRQVQKSSPLFRNLSGFKRRCNTSTLRRPWHPVVQSGQTNLLSELPFVNHNGSLKNPDESRFVTSWNQRNQGQRLWYFVGQAHNEGNDRLSRLTIFC